jgi:signal transduction histidine kinase
LKHLRRLISCRRAAVVLIDTVKGEAEILSYDTDDITSLQPGTRFSLEGGTLIEDLRKGEMRIIEDVESIQNPHPVFQRLRAEGIRSGIYFPLIAHGELIGLMSMESDEPGAFSMADIDIYGESAAHLAVALYNARLLGEVRRYADELESRVAERTAQLEAINRELEAFSYSVSHDLRAPLRAVDGFSQALLEDYYDQLDEQGRRFLTRVRTAAQRMAQLIDDILGLSRVTRGEMRRETVDMTALALVIAEELRSQEPGRGVDFVIEPGLVVKGDPVLLRQVLFNLLDNAFKFTGGCKNAHIEFGVEAIEGNGAFFVRDNGAGFDMDYAGKLFGVFQRLHSVDEFPGTGIGLATVQRIVHRHGGEVWGSGEVDKGATFYFTIPGS